MNERDPLIVQIASQLANIAYVMLVAALVAVARYLQVIRRRFSDFSWWRLCLAALAGAINGYFSFLLCDSMDLAWQTTAFITGASGAMGNELMGAFIDRAKLNLNLKDTRHDDR